MKIYYISLSGSWANKKSQCNQRQQSRRLYYLWCNYDRSRNLEFTIVDSCLAKTKSHSQINSLAVTVAMRRHWSGEPITTLSGPSMSMFRVIRTDYHAGRIFIAHVRLILLKSAAWGIAYDMQGHAGQDKGQFYCILFIAGMSTSLAVRCMIMPTVV